MNDSAVVTDTCNELVAAVAHEIKNPVALALANISLIRMEDEAQKLSGYCAMIERALMHINDLSLQLIDASGDGTTTTVFNVSELLEGIVDDNRSAWPHIRFYYHKPLQPVIYEGDVNKIQMVFTNLLKNAVEATEDCEDRDDLADARVEVVLQGSADTMQITIRDSGTGIDDDTRAQIASGRYTSKPNGSGMGLVICRTIVARCGGRFQMRNRAGGGCEAVVTLPIVSPRYA